MKFNRRQIDNILTIIQKYTTVFVAGQVGTSHLTFFDKLLLKTFGIDVNKFPKYTAIEKMFYFGVLSSTLGKKKTSNLTYKQFSDYFKEGRHIPLSDEEKEAIDHLKSRSYNDISGLGNRIKNSFSNSILYASQKRKKSIKNLVKRKTIEAVSKNKGQAWLASELKNLTKDWARDFDRIADYLMHEAYDTGRAQAILKQYGPDIEVYKDVYAGACKHCIRLHLTDGHGSEPILYKLGDVIANGTNIGRKTRDWKVVIGPTHPYCRCTIAFRKPNTVWNPATLSYSTVVRNTLGVKRTSRAVIQLDGQDL